MCNEWLNDQINILSHYCHTRTRHWVKIIINVMLSALLCPSDITTLMFSLPPLFVLLCVCACLGRDLQGRFPGRARGQGEAEPEEGGAAGSADSSPG